MDDREFINEILAEIEPQNTFYIDIGCGGMLNIGKDRLRSQDLDLAILCDPRRRGDRPHPGRPNIHWIPEYITPVNILSVLGDITSRRDPKIVDIDIDGYDFFVLESFLKEYYPTIIMIEINEKIPPPISFSVKYSPTYHHDGTHFYGCSLTKVYNFLKNRYDLVHLAWNNAYFVLKEKNFKATTGLPYHAHTDVEAYNKFYRNKNWEDAMPHNRNMKPLLVLSPIEGYKFLKQYFKSLLHREEEYEIALAPDDEDEPLTHKKEKKMSTKETKEIREELSSLRARISTLVDEMSLLKNEVKRFKENVASDVKYLTDRVDNSNFLGR